MKTISELQNEVHKIAKEKGWWEKPKSPLEIHMLIVSEVAESTEEARLDNDPVYFEGISRKVSLERFKDKEPYGAKPEGELIELADAVIRIMDYCGYKDWDLERAIELKMNYNKLRGYRHGNKKY